MWATRSTARNSARSTARRFPPRRRLEIRGVSIHPGWAKGVMVNALRLAGSSFRPSRPRCPRSARRPAMDSFIRSRSRQRRPVHVRMILRDFELAGLAAKRTRWNSGGGPANRRPRAVFTLTVSEQYRTCATGWRRTCGRWSSPAKPSGAQDWRRSHGDSRRHRWFEPHRPRPALPNLFCGMHEVHSQREWVCLQDMAKSVETLLPSRRAVARAGVRPACRESHEM